MNDEMPRVEIGEDGVCNFCKNHEPFKPWGESELLKVLNRGRKGEPKYHALVPLSGGKDSTYVLYLAVKKFNLRILTYTFDNGFMSELAKLNIETSVKKCGVDHVWVKKDEVVLKEFYRTTLLQSGEICGICGVGIERSMLKISRDYKIPLILLGHAPAEQNSFSQENIYDPEKLKAILKTSPTITRGDVEDFLVYPKLSFFKANLLTRAGVFGRKVNLLFYLDLPTDAAISEILKDEMDWKEPADYEYTRHFDCKAEPLTNYVREQRLGTSRRLPQLCNMIRNNELTKEKARVILETDAKNMKPENYAEIMNHLSITPQQLEAITKIPLHVFDEHISKSNKIFAYLRERIGGIIPLLTF